MAHNIKPRTGDQVQEILFIKLKEKDWKFPVMLLDRTTVNCNLKTAAYANAQVIIQFSMVEHSTLEWLSM
jgi:hypothetical protein